MNAESKPTVDCMEDQNFLIKTISEDEKGENSLLPERGLTSDTTCISPDDIDGDINDNEDCNDEISEGSTAATTDIADMENVYVHEQGVLNSDFVDHDDEGDTETDGAAVSVALDLQNDPKNNESIDVKSSDVDLRHFFMHLNEPICRNKHNQQNIQSFTDCESMAGESSKNGKI